MNKLPVANLAIRPGAVASTLVVAALLLGAAPVHGVGFESEGGEVYGSWDTTLSYGLSWRVQDRDEDLIGLTNGGTRFSVNGDDGNLNWGRGLYSNAVKATSELEVNYKSFGAFVRGRGFYDFEVKDAGPERTELSEQAEDLVGSDLNLLDAFIWAKFSIGSLPAELRLGEQVVSWGESTFIQNGINVVNHFDVSALRVPGAELKEALLPQSLAWFSMNMTDNTALELLYQLHWDDTEPDPAGAYFAFNDFAVKGGNTVFLAFGDVRDIDPQIPYAPCDICPRGPDSAIPPGSRQFQGVPRGATVEPPNSGQFGAAFRWFLPNFIGGTELSFYYTKYHSRLPLINARTGTIEGLQAAAAISAEAASIAGAAGAAFAANPSDPGAAIEAGVAVTNATPDYAATGIAAAQITGGNVATVARAYAVDLLAATSEYFTSYPEDIQLFGIGFNTQVGGVALQGEYSFRKDVPLQIDDLEILFAALSPISNDLARGQLGSFSFNTASPVFNANTPPQTVIFGYKRFDVSQFQFTATQVFPPTLGASQAVLLFEGALNYTHDMLPKDVLRFNGPGTDTSGNPDVGPISHPGKAVVGAEHFADATSWGYRLAGRLDYLNVIGPINVLPFFSWQHDVNGVSPGPGGSFLEGRKALTLGVRANYQSRWEGALIYTSFFGGGRPYNEIIDRDFVSASVSYSF